MEKDRQSILLKTAALIMSILLLWFSAGLIDYMRVICFYREPVFCVSQNADERGGSFHGLGYTYEIKGNFDRSGDSFADPYGVHYAKLKVFGNEVKIIYRGVHE